MYRTVVTATFEPSACCLAVRRIVILPSLSLTFRRQPTKRNSPFLGRAAGS